MRVIAGMYKGRRLKTLEGMHVSPTADRLRETLFNVLAPQIEGARFIDICAGSGAVGIEAKSRGVASVIFIEASRKAAAIIEENLRYLGIDEGVRVINRDALAALKNLGQREMQFDLCYFDPPYESEIHSPVLWQIAKHNLLAEGGLVIVEHRRRLTLSLCYDQLRPYREIVQGETSLTFYAMER